MRSVIMVPITLRFDSLRYLKTAALLTAIFCLAVPLGAQDIARSGGAESAPVDSAPDLQSAPMASTREKWDTFVRETASPMTFGGGAFNATFSQLTNSDPQYGVDNVAYAERIAASIADIASQNFFGDFVVASVV